VENGRSIILLQKDSIPGVDRKVKDGRIG